MRQAILNAVERRFFYGWVIVALAFLSSFAGVGVITRSFPVILKPLTEDLGIPRTMGVLGVALAAVVTGVASPFIGRLVDRRGPRLLMGLSAAVMGGGLIALSQVENGWLFLVLFAALTGLPRPALMSVGGQATVAKWFIRRRGRAVTFSTLGLPFSAIVIIPLTQWMVSNYGWRFAWLALGLAVLVLLIIPAVLLLWSTPEEAGLRPDGEGRRQAGRREAREQENRRTGGQEGRHSSLTPHASSLEIDWPAKEAFKTRTFWMLTLAFTVITLVPSVLTIHMFPHFTDQGLSPAAAAAANGSFGIAVIGSRILVWGFALEKLPMRVTLMLWGSLMTAAVTVMLLVSNELWAYAGALSFGFAMGGTAPLETLTWAHYFGRKNVGTITGLAHLLGSISSIAGPIFASVVYDVSGSYDSAFIISAAVCFTGVLMLLFAGNPRPPASVLAGQAAPVPSPSGRGSG